MAGPPVHPRNFQILHRSVVGMVRVLAISAPHSVVKTVWLTRSPGWKSATAWQVQGEFGKSRVHAVGRVKVSGKLRPARFRIF